MESNKIQTEQEEMMTLSDLWYLCLARWKWFVVSIVITLGIASWHILTTHPSYASYAELMIKDNSRGRYSAPEMEGFSELGIFQTASNVNNELIAIQSPAVMYEVAKRLHLDMNYFTKGTFHNKIAYGTNLPISVSLLELSENQSAKFTLDLQENGTFTLSDFSYYLEGEAMESDTPVQGTLSDTINSPIGKILVLPKASYRVEYPITFKITKIPLVAATARYTGALQASLMEKRASVLKLSIRDISAQRAQDVINTLIAVYNENWVKDKNQIAVSTSMFINERLKVIERELGHVDESISSYKSENLLPDLKQASSMYMEQSSKNAIQITALNNQLYMARYVRGYLTDPAHKNQLLPANSGIESANIESQIQSYNTQLLQRNGLVANSSETNPLVVDMDQNLASMRKAIVISIDNQVETLNTQLRSLQQMEQQTTTRIAKSPTQAKYLLSVERQQKVKEQLYLLLLKKREENELTQAFTAYNTRLITPPRTSNAPVSPKKKLILLAALVLGVGIPMGIIYCLEIFNTKLRGRKDLEKLTIPFAGEIPALANQQIGILTRKKVDPTPKKVVEAGNRNIINEAFRVLRTNLEFMEGQKKQTPVILTTSFNPASGKSFITYNLGMALALKKQKVLIIDGDLRHTSTSAYVDNPEVGLSDYLNHRVADFHEIVVSSSDNENLHVLPVGTVPPNPTELLVDERLSSLLEKVKEEYDYVFIDCPPVEIVADTQIWNRWADRTLFVVRAGLMERSMLPALENMYKDGKLTNMSVVLNGTEGAEGRYGSKYGYRYGYHYGYKSNGYYNNYNMKS